MIRLPFPLLWLAPGALVAQEPGGGFGDLKALLELRNTPVVAASKREQRPLESPQAVEVLTAEQIRASGVFRLVDVLGLLTNVQVHEMGNDQVHLSIRGASVNAQRRNVQVLVDGVPLFNAGFGSVQFDLIPIPVDAIERVEVVRGPSSSLYGANAQVGVISISTKRAREGTSLSLRAGAAQDGTFGSQGFASHGAAAFSLAAGFGGQSLRDSGISNRILGGPRTVDPEDPRHTSHVFLRPEVVLGGGRLWALLAQARNRTGPETQESLTGVPLYRFGRTGAATEAGQLGWAQTWSPSLRTEVLVNRTHLRPIQASPMEVVPGSPTSAALVPLLWALDPQLRSSYDLMATTTDQLTFQANWEASPTLHLVIGADAARSRLARTPIAGIHSEERDSASGGFASVDWGLGPATLSLGARVENDTRGGARTSPRAALVYTLSDGAVLRAGYFTSTRSPQVGELKQDVPIPGRPAPLGNPALEPETFDSAELGYRKEWPTWSLALTAYRMNLDKVISPEPTGLLVGGFAQTRFQNTHQPLHNQGLELTLQGQARAGWHLGFNAATVAFKDASGRQESYSPSVKATLWSRHRSARFQAYGALQYLGGFRLANPSDIGGPSEQTQARLQVHFNLDVDLGSGCHASLYGVNAARPSDETTAGSVQNSHLVRFSRREWGIQVAWRY